MKSFVFSLARMRNYKEQLLDKEKITLRALQKKKNDIEEQIHQVQLYRDLKKAELQRRQVAGMDAFGLSEYSFFLENTRLQLEDLHKQLIAAEREVEIQLQIVIQASREVAGLDKLEEKQLEEYRQLEAKDNELQIQEHVITALVRKQADAAVN